MHSRPAHPAPIYLLGQTACGKSAVAVELARLCSGEIISVDSMQVYEGLDIGTAKPSKQDRAEIPHHLIDVAKLHESFDAAAFLRLATAARDEIQQRARLPIFCGGTGFYFTALLSGLGEAPPSNPALRADLERTPLPELLEELKLSDPATFQTIDLQNPRRIVRAIEVIRTSGKPFSEQRAVWGQPDATDHCLVGIRRPPAELRRRQEERVDEMFRRGLVAEVEHLKALGLARNPTASQAIGYKQVLAHLQGELPLAETVQLIKQKTWQYSKRQKTWFARQLQVHWLDVSATEPPGVTARRIHSHWTDLTSREPR